MLITVFITAYHLSLCCQINALHVLPPCFLKINLNIMLQLSPRSSKYFFPLRFLTKTLYAFFLPHTYLPFRNAHLPSNRAFSSYCIIQSVFCLTTGPKPPPKRCLHIVRCRASSFKSEYPLLSLEVFSLKLNT